MRDFIERWRGRGDEKSDTQIFWIEFLKKVCGVENPTEIIEFEKRVKLQHKGYKGYIDAYIPSTKVLIEQKSATVDLNAKIQQSDGSLLTPFEQAERYYGKLPHFENPRWIIICNFQEFQIHDMNTPDDPPEIIKLEDLEKEQRRFLFLIDEKAKAPKSIREEEISIRAGELVGELKRSLEALYNKDVNENVLKKQQESLTIFCVRIVFLLYAEDSGLFNKNQFHDYLNERRVMASDALEKLFRALNLETGQRDPYKYDDCKDFPYVNGGLFEKENIIIPNLNGEILDIIVNKMSAGFDWSGINPTIFGAIFESVINEHARQSAGMHYTSVENIHKVIDPLFLDSLNDELENILKSYKGKDRAENLIRFQNKLASLRFLDPACGSGNFLTESFMSLRRLENKILHELKESGHEAEIKVSIFQFYGIDADEFAVAVTQTALYIANNQMLNESADVIRKAPLPLEKYHNIKYGSAMDALQGVGWGLPGWTIEHEDMLYIMGNPPFLGYSLQDDGQKSEVRHFFGTAKVDYVACWFAKASTYLNEKIKAAFVATNSITQGEQVALIFKPLHKEWHIEIDFAYHSFVWESEVADESRQAHVHCVIIGFSTTPPELRKLYTHEGLKLVKNINFYLKPEPNFFLEAREIPICNVPPMMLGNLPRDGGHLIIKNQEKYEDFIMQEPDAEKFIKPYIGADEFINNKRRYCLWLVDATPNELSNMPLVMERIRAVKRFRLASNRRATQNLAASSWLFAEIRQPNSNYIIVPRTSSETREYVPLGFMSPDIIPSDAVCIIPDADLYHFGILTSRVHMAWMRLTAGRLEMRYRYSNTVVYNNFVWPSANEKQRAKIESTAQKILDARNLYPESSFASLYNDDLMPKELRKAHEANDSAVCAAYGFDKNISEEEIVERLVKLYEGRKSK